MQVVELRWEARELHAATRADTSADVNSSHTASVGAVVDVGVDAGGGMPIEAHACDGDTRVDTLGPSPAALEAALNCADVGVVHAIQLDRGNADLAGHRSSAAECDTPTHHDSATHDDSAAHRSSSTHHSGATHHDSAGLDWRRTANMAVYRGFVFAPIYGVFVRWLERAVTSTGWRGVASKTLLSQVVARTTLAQSHTFPSMLLHMDCGCRSCTHGKCCPVVRHHDSTLFSTVERSLTLSDLTHCERISIVLTPASM
jgi:hypothetical protein